MKKLIALSLFTLAAMAGPLPGHAQANIENDPAYLAIDKVLDLKAIPPQVNVNLPQFLLKDAISGLTSTNLGPEGAELADLVKDVKLIRVVVIEAREDNRAAVTKAMKSLRSELDAKWTSIVKVSDNDDNVGIYAMGDKSGQSVAGVAVLVHDGKDAIIANIVGNVSIGKLLKIAAQTDKLPKNLLKQLQGGGNGGEDHAVKPAPKVKKAPAHSATTNAPPESAEKAEKETAEK